MIITRQQILTGLHHNPCVDYPDGRIEEIFGNRNEMPLLEALQLPLPARDIIWAITLYDGILADCHLHELACRYAEHALSVIDHPDPCSVAAIAAKRAWLQAEITDGELAAAAEAAWEVARDAATKAAAAEAARGAVREAAWETAAEAAWEAAREAARAAAEAQEATWAAEWAAAWAAAWDDLLQITQDYLVEVLCGS